MGAKVQSSPHLYITILKLSFCNISQAPLIRTIGACHGMWGGMILKYGAGLMKCNAPTTAILCAVDRIFRRATADLNRRTSS
jgi:hypothetical protein